jgi:hypothetical protein
VTAVVEDMLNAVINELSVGPGVFEVCRGLRLGVKLGVGVVPDDIWFAVPDGAETRIVPSVGSAVLEVCTGSAGPGVEMVVSSVLGVGIWLAITIGTETPVVFALICDKELGHVLICAGNPDEVLSPGSQLVTEHSMASGSFKAVNRGRKKVKVSSLDSSAFARTLISITIPERSGTLNISLNRVTNAFELLGVTVGIEAKFVFDDFPRTGEPSKRSSDNGKIMIKLLYICRRE